MQKVNLEFFYQLGAVLRPVTQIKPETDTRLEAWTACLTAREQVRNLLSTVSLPTCNQRGNELIKAIDGWTNLWDMSQIGNPIAQAEQWPLQQIVNLAGAFEIVLYSAVQTLPTMILEKRGGYAPETLMTSMEEVLTLPVRMKITNEIAADVNDAGKCLAFDSGTAAGFHILRAFEGVMYLYYLEVCKPKNKSKPRSWMQYIKKLDAVPDKKVKKVVAMIELLKDQDRNFIMHPEDTLTVDEALSLFEQCKTLMISMAEKLPNPQPA